MRKIKRGILSLCLFYIIYVFLYDIVIKLTMLSEIIFSVKTHIPEIILEIICVMAVMCNGSRIHSNSALLITWSFLIFVINVINYGAGESMFYLLRDIYIPILTFCFISGSGCNRTYLQPLLILFCALSMTVNITQGRGFLSEFLLLLGIGSVIIDRGVLLERWIKSILQSIRAKLQSKSMAFCRAERGLAAV